MNTTHGGADMSERKCDENDEFFKLFVYQIFYLQAYLSIYLSTYLPTYLSAYLPAHLPTYFLFPCRQS